MVNDIREVLLTKEEIEEVVKELGKKNHRRLQRQKPVPYHSAERCSCIPGRPYACYRNAL